MMIILLAVQSLSVLLILQSATSSFYSKQLYEQEKTAEYWYNAGLKEVQEALQKPTIEGRAKNVILFLGDGMGISTITAGRIFKGQKAGLSGEETYLSFERFPNTALLKTYNVDKQVADSAGTATAYLTGVKANYHTVGVTAAVKIDDCEASLKSENRLESILKWAQDAGKETGFVTTTRVTHATPAASYASSSNRNWECDAKIKKSGIASALNCRDIGRQLIEQDPGRNFKVVMGGGRQPLGSQFPNSTSGTCKRMDGRNLVSEWLTSKRAAGISVGYATTTEELDNIDPLTTDTIVGLFAESHMPYDRNRDKSKKGEPSLKEMTKKAIQRLQRSEEGFALLVEGGRIDHGLHDSRPQLAVEEVVAFDEAIETALGMVDLQDTLVIVTADHSHGLTINGYPERGNDILGFTSYEKVTDNMEFTTMMMSTGPGYNYTYDGMKVVRQNVTGANTTDYDFRFLATVPTKDGWSMHSGEDVAVFAAGPYAHLFHRVHEQNYVAHVIGYSAKMGPYAKSGPYYTVSPERYTYASAVANHSAFSLTIISAVLVIINLFVYY